MSVLSSWSIQSGQMSVNRYRHITWWSSSAVGLLDLATTFSNFGTLTHWRSYFVQIWWRKHKLLALLKHLKFIDNRWFSHEKDPVFGNSKLDYVSQKFDYWNRGNEVPRLTRLLQVHKGGQKNALLYPRSLLVWGELMRWATHFARIGRNAHRTTILCANYAANFSNLVS